MKASLPLFLLIVALGADLVPVPGSGLAGQAQAAGLRLNIALGDRHRRDDNNPEVEARGRELDRAIAMVERRTGGHYVSAEPIGDGVYRVVVRIGPRIKAYRVDIRTGSMEEE